MQEMEEQWDDKAIKRFIASGEEDFEPTLATDGKEHVVLIATDGITGEILGCVEARGMQGYLRPKSIPPIAPEDAQEQVSKPADVTLVSLVGSFALGALLYII